MNELSALRDEINACDDSITAMFCRRMKAAERIGSYKKEHGLPVYDAEREAELLKRIETMAGDRAEECLKLYAAILSISRERQRKLTGENTEDTASAGNSKAILTGYGKLRTGLIGGRLIHSYSPAIHALLADYKYRLFELKPEELEQFIKNGDYDAINVTVPYKQTVMQYLDTASDEALKIGAVNVIKRQDGRICGYNTDYFGFEYLLKRWGVSVAGKKTLVLGSGGASHTVCAVLEAQGADVTVISRTGKENYANLHLHADADFIINTTPVGMYPGPTEAPLELSIFNKLSGVADIIYNPARTKLLCDAEKMGIPFINGLPMLAAQAKQACEVFTGCTLPESSIETVIDEIGFMMENIVLIGMPGCGKTTVGRATAELLGRKFVDTDEIITEKYGSIPDIIQKNGEEYFRKLEHEALSGICCGSGMVIATGGGVVTKAENYSVIHPNARIVFIDRNISELACEGRPLSLQRGTDALWNERAPLYSRFADITVKPRINGYATAVAVIDALHRHHTEGNEK